LEIVRLEKEFIFEFFENKHLDFFVEKKARNRFVNLEKIKIQAWVRRRRFFLGEIRRRFLIERNVWGVLAFLIQSKNLII